MPKGLWGLWSRENGARMRHPARRAFPLDEGWIISAAEQLLARVGAHRRVFLQRETTRNRWTVPAIRGSKACRKGTVFVNCFIVSVPGPRGTQHWGCEGVSPVRVARAGVPLRGRSPQGAECGTRERADEGGCEAAVEAVTSGGMSESAASRALPRERCALLEVTFSAFQSRRRVDLRSPAGVLLVALLTEHSREQSKERPRARGEYVLY